MSKIRWAAVAVLGLGLAGCGTSAAISGSASQPATQQASVSARASVSTPAAPTSVPDPIRILQKVKGIQFPPERGAARMTDAYGVQQGTGYLGYTPCTGSGNLPGCDNGSGWRVQVWVGTSVQAIKDTYAAAGKTNPAFQGDPAVPDHYVVGSNFILEYTPVAYGVPDNPPVPVSTIASEVSGHIVEVP